MSQKTAISWTDHTFNPWWGCTKVSPGCANCYAERDAKRYGHDIWGPGKPRRVFGTKHWAEPGRWNRVAERERVRKRVFCASMADIFEDEALVGERNLLYDTIDATPWLDWQLLTKRPENFQGALPARWLLDPPKNVWLGVSVEDQATADERIPLLLQTQAALRFVSYEPALAPVDFGMYLSRTNMPGLNLMPGFRDPLPGIDWVIVGGESGPGARPFNLAWARASVAQCKATGVAVFVKQLGARTVGPRLHAPTPNDPGTVAFLPRWADAKGGDPTEWPVDLRVQEFPKAA